MKQKKFRVKIKLDQEMPEDIKYKNLWNVFDAILNNTEEKNKKNEILSN